jgi:hypothetical protein
MVLTVTGASPRNPGSDSAVVERDSMPKLPHIGRTPISFGNPNRTATPSLVSSVMARNLDMGIPCDESVGSAPNLGALLLLMIMVAKI